VHLSTDSERHSITSSGLCPVEGKGLEVNGLHPLNEVTSSTLHESSLLVNGVHSSDTVNMLSNVNANPGAGGDATRKVPHNGASTVNVSHSGPMKGNSINTPHRYHPYSIATHHTDPSLVRSSAASINVATISSSTFSQSSSHNVASNGSAE